MASRVDEKPGYRYVRVADAIRSQVLSGGYQPGERLTSQHELARELGVAFTTLHKALDLLSEEGYVVRHVGQGTYASLPRDARQSALVVDDDPGTREFMAEAIQRHGWKCVTVDSGARALACLADEQFDLIFLDLAMPGMNGAQTFRTIRSVDPLANVVIITAYADSHLMTEALKVGRFSLMPKPFGLEDLHLTLDAAAKRPELAQSRR